MVDIFYSHNLKHKCLLSMLCIPHCQMIENIVCIHLDRAYRHHLHQDSNPARKSHIFYHFGRIYIHSVLHHRTCTWCLLKSLSLSIHYKYWHQSSQDTQEWLNHSFYTQLGKWERILDHKGCINFHRWSIKGTDCRQYRHQSMKQWNYQVLYIFQWWPLCKHPIGCTPDNQHLW